MERDLRTLGCLAFVAVWAQVPRFCVVVLVIEVDFRRRALRLVWIVLD